jgi:hypothetical protein
LLPGTSTLCPPVAAPHPTEARFPAVPIDAGHYESFYIKACRPGEPLGVWIRYTVHKRPDALPNGSLWLTLFDGAAEGPRAHKETMPGPSAGADWIRVGEASMRAGAAVGAIDGAEWDLRFATSEPPLYHLPGDWMYRARLPRTKLLSPLPAARFDGTLRVDGRTITVDGWPGVIGHNWGAQHAERWIWLHCLTEGGDWLDAALGKVKLGRFTTPWVGSGAISLGGERYALGGPGRKLEVREAPDGCDFLLTGKGLRVRGNVSARRKDVVGWVYADPDGSEHNTVNCSIADMDLRVERDGAPATELTVQGAAAYELGMRERDHGIPIQPFPDG